MAVRRERRKEGTFQNKAFTSPQKVDRNLSCLCPTCSTKLLSAEVQLRQEQGCQTLVSLGCLRSGEVPVLASALFLDGPTQRLACRGSTSRSGPPNPPTTPNQKAAVHPSPTLGQGWLCLTQSHAQDMLHVPSRTGRVPRKLSIK